MATIREVLYQSMKGRSNREIAKSFMICRKTVAKYVRLGKGQGFHDNVEDELLDDIAVKVQDSIQAKSSNKAITASIAVHKDKILA